MKTTLKYKSKISAVLVVIMIASMLFSIQVTTVAASGTIYESESNGAISTADVTYDDYDNYGAISSTSDEDYWKITPTVTGFANIWLGNMSTSTNYDIYLYSSSGTYMACSVQTGTTQELMKCRLTSGKTYYIRVMSPSDAYSSTQYKLRIKLNDMGKARSFAFNYSDISISQTTASDITAKLDGSGYNAQWYLNNTVGPAYDVLPSSRIFVVHSHANAGKIRFGYSSNVYTGLYADAYNDMPSYNRAISEIGDLSEVAFIMFLGCKTGLTDTSSNNYGNLVYTARNRGVFCAMGWNVLIGDASSTEWAISFFENCSLDKNAENAATAADLHLKEIESDYYEQLKNRFTASRLSALVI